MSNLRCVGAAGLSLLVLRAPAHSRAECANNHDNAERPHCLHDSVLPTRKTLIVKYGGSAITYKGKLETLNKHSLDAAAMQVLQVHKEGVWKNIVIVHGAGSFGHFQARAHNLKNGGFSSLVSGIADDSALDWRQGLVLTRQSVLKLNKHVMDAHIMVNLPVVSVSAFPSVVTGISTNALDTKINTNGSQIVHSGALASIEGVLNGGLIPVLHGDVVLDKQQRCAILGGDHIIYWLCENQALPPAGLAIGSPINKYSTKTGESSSRMRVVFLTDVAGVYDRAPRLPGATLIKRISVLPDGTMDIVAATETAAHDVTGGIEAKIQAAVNIAKLGKHVDVCIVQAGSESALQALRGETPDFGTVIALK